MTNTDLSISLLKWYSCYGRDLPWRVKGGAHPDPYIILVSEFMLQQTTVKTVIPYFHRFMKRFPDIQTLATATIDEVYQLWQGLGYYTRARSLHSTAQIISEKYNGKFPTAKKEVLKLKGFGPYTAASFLALAFNLPETVIDGNVTRIICRLYRLTAAPEEIQNIIREKAEKLTSRSHPADYASAIMDLGATICTPQNPRCLLCPWQTQCLSANAPDVEKIPTRKKTERLQKSGSVYLIQNNHGELFIRKRTEKGLLSGLYEFPWTESETPLYPAQDTLKEVTHIFTHIKLSLRIYTLQRNTHPGTGLFVKPEELKNYPFSTLMKKILVQYLKQG